VDAASEHVDRTREPLPLFEQEFMRLEAQSPRVGDIGYSLMR
jgi:hypothetical protein